jgi:hypothetical protein
MDHSTQQTMRLSVDANAESPLFSEY